METVYLAGGCLWGVQAFIKTLPGVKATEAGRANGTSDTLDGRYDGYAECVKTEFDPAVTSIDRLMDHLFKIIDPYSVDRQGATGSSSGAAPMNSSTTITPTLPKDMRTTC